MIKAIAIDDEPLALTIVRNFANRVPFILLLESFTDPMKAIPFLETEKPDLVFLDIKMPDISGIEWARSLPAPPMIIFTTAYSEHALESFELDAVDYLLKPFSFERFLKAVNKAHSLLQLKQSALETGHIFIKTGSEQVKILLDEIIYIQSAGNYVQFYLSDKKLLSRLTMSEASSMLAASEFIRVHRSFIISRSKISRLDRQHVWLGEQAIPIGSGYFEEVNKLVNK